MLNYLNELTGRRVAVWTGDQGGAKDEGTLDGFDGTCIRLRKEKPGGESVEVFVFPIQNVRLVKLLDER